MNDDHKGSYGHRAPALFLTWLEARRWRVSLTDEGEFQVLIGADDPAMSQAEILEALAMMKPSLVALLRAQEQVH